MVPEEWPIVGPAAERVAGPPRPAGRSRVATVRRDFFLHPDERLTEQERALMTAMLHGLVSDVADEIRAALPATSAVANDDDNSALIAELRNAGLLDLEPLLELLLRRADEEQISSAVRARSGRRDGRFLQALVSDEDASVSAAAMSLILARGRRRDRFGQARAELDDLATETAERLVHTVAAAMRGRLAVTGAVRADQQLTEAAARLLAHHDPTKQLEALTAQLVRLLDDAGRLDDDLIAVAVDEGEMGFVGEALARRAAIPSDEALDRLLCGDGATLMLLMRMAGVSREFAARLLAGPGELLGITDPGREISRFDSLAAEKVEAAREWLQLDPHYRNALSTLGQDHGQRSF